MYTSPAALIKYQQYKKMPGIQCVKSIAAAHPPVTCTYVKVQASSARVSINSPPFWAGLD
jgi:hypothetical protein